MSNLINIIVSEQLLSFWIVFFVILVERSISWPDKYHPLSVITLLANGMAKKVLPSKPRQISQQKIAGTLAPIILLLPVCATLVVLIYLSEYPIFFDILMLLIAIKFKQVIIQTKKVSAALRSEKNILARQRLSPLVLRETEKMSPMGLVKANIESVLLRFCYQYCSVIFWYMLAGGVGALIYRILYELCLCWNDKQPKFKHFGQPIRWLTTILQSVPSVLATFSIICAGNIHQGIKMLIQKSSYQSMHAFILNCSGASLDVELGGPAYYGQHKIRTLAYGGKKQVILADNLQALNIINRAIWVWLTGYFLYCAILFFKTVS